MRSGPPAIAPTFAKQADLNKLVEQIATLSPAAISTSKVKIDIEPNEQRVLAKYTIPLGANQATLVFTGDRLTGDDFTDLIAFVEFIKKQFERAQKSVIIEAVAPSFDTKMDYHAQTGSPLEDE